MSVDDIGATCQPQNLESRNISASNHRGQLDLVHRIIESNEAENNVSRLELPTEKNNTQYCQILELSGIVWGSEIHLMKVS